VTAGGLPERRIDQRLLGTSRAGTGPAPQNGVFARLFVAGDIIINSAGAFFYNGTPGLGTLVLSIAPNGGGTDQFGNVFPQGTNFGIWSGTGALEQHFGVNAGGDIFLASASGAVVMHGRSSDGALFFYNAAGQGAGNLLTSIAPTAGTDPAGNTYPAGLEVQGGGQIAVVGSNGAIITMFISGGNPIMEWLSGYVNETQPAYIQVNLFNIGGANEYISQIMRGPSVSGQADAVVIELNSSQNNGGNNAFGSLGYQDTSSVLQGMLNWGPAGINGMGQLTAVKPGTGTVAVDAVAETWHTLSLSATWTANASGTLPQYRLNVTGMVDIKGDVVFTSTGVGLSGNNTFTAAGAIPAAYQPATNQYFATYLVAGTGTPVIAANRTPIVQVAANGQLTLFNVSSTGGAGLTAVFGFKGSYQLAN
jgi:hypothetical protein